MESESLIWKLIPKHNCIRLKWSLITKNLTQGTNEQGITETLEKAWNALSNDEYTRTTSLTSFWCFYSYLWTYSIPFSNVSMTHFEHGLTCRDISLFPKKLLENTKKYTTFLPRNFVVLSWKTSTWKRRSTRI